MVLPGLRICIVLGWSHGIILLKKPWGTPEFRWLCIPILLWFVYTPFFLFIIADILYHSHETVSAFAKSSSRIDRLVLIFLFLQLFFSNLLFRLIFLWKAKQLADLLGRLKRYTEARSRNSVHKGGCLSHVNMDFIITMTVLATTVLIAGIEGVGELLLHGKTNTSSWNHELLGSLGQGLTFTFLFLIPVMVPSEVAFTVIVMLTDYLSHVFEDYCSYVWETVREGKRVMGMSIIRPQEYDQDEEYDKRLMAYLGKGEKRIFFSDEMRRELLSKFELIREVFDLAHEIISPLALVLLAGASIDVVMEAYEIFLLSEEWLDRTKDGLHLVNYICCFWVLQCGQRVTDKIQAWKSKFEDTLVQLSEDTHQMQRQTVKDVLGMLKLWNWKFTAMDFFVIDRKLASGVVSLVMTYVVVLIQLKVSDPTSSDGLKNKTGHGHGH